MAKSDIDKQIRARIDAFLGELSVLVRKAAVESVAEALGGNSAAPPARRGPGRPRKDAAAKAGAAPKATSRKAGKRVRRTVADIEAAKEKIMAFLTARPGSRMEEISAALKMASKDLRRPMQMLQAEKKVSVKGQKRAAAYSVVGEGGGKPAVAKGKQVTRKPTAKKKGRNRRGERTESGKRTNASNV